VAAGRLLGIDLDAVRAMPGVVRVITAADIPGVNDCGSAVPTTPSCATATSATWASRCSPSSPHARCGRRAAALAKVLRVEAAGPC
jgi:xanthine dehydrogenase large subunit